MQAGSPRRRQASRTEIVVVGAGVLGLCAARELGRRGHDVVCLEQQVIGHERSGSKSESRLFRLSHNDPFYVRLARRALVGWKDLQAEVGCTLLEPAELVLFGDRLADYRSAMAAAGASAQLVSRTELSERFGGFAFHGPGGFNGEALLEDTARILLAKHVLEALARVMRAELREREPATGITQTEHGVIVETDAGAYRCDCAVLCAGAWSSALGRQLGIGAAAVLEPTLGQVAYLRPRAGVLGRVPAFMELATARAGSVPSYAWGVPTPTQGTYKIGLHRDRPRVDPSSVSLAPDEQELAELRDRAEKLLPGFDPRPVATERCFFDGSPDEDLVVDRVGRIVIGAGTSGRGFKFGPALGEALADLAEGRQPAATAGRFTAGRAALLAAARAL
jgi:sarcosine oxidase